MKGLDLAESYFEEYGLPVIRSVSEHLEYRCAAGLAGPGSECLGFDDEISKDHDWGPGFCIWLEPGDFEKFGDRLSEAYASLPQVHLGFGPRIVSRGEDFRTGVMASDDFFRRYTGLDHKPVTIREWMVPVQNLGLCTNGRVFHDPSGFFTEIRRYLSENYPEDLRLKRLAARCLDAGQAGQYGLYRALKRGEMLGAHHDLVRFCESVLLAVFLLNREYPPYYKWLRRAAAKLPVLGAEAVSSVDRLVSAASAGGFRAGFESEAEALVEPLCVRIAAELGRQRLSVLDSDFLVDQALHLNERIEDGQLREFPFSLFR